MISHFLPAVLGSRPLTMNVVQSRPVSSRITEDSASRATKQVIDFYRDIPSYELSLDEFEEYALARLKVCCLRVVIERDVLYMLVSLTKISLVGPPQTGRAQDPQRDGLCLSPTDGRCPAQDGPR